MEFILDDSSYSMTYDDLERKYPQVIGNFKIVVGVDSAVYITIDSMDELMKFIELVDCEVIVDTDTIMIYDGYIE